MQLISESRVKSCPDPAEIVMECFGVLCVCCYHSPCSWKKCICFTANKQRALSVFFSTARIMLSCTSHAHIMCVYRNCQETPLNCFTTYSNEAFNQVRCFDCHLCLTELGVFSLVQSKTANDACMNA